jgi:hypothetical protein
MARGLIIQDRDRGWKKLGKVIKDRRVKYVDVGVMAVHDLRSDDVGNVMLAMVHEFGLGVPERSFIRDLIDQNQTMYIKFINKLAYQVAIGRISKKVALTLLGAKVEADMKAYVRAGIDPGLAASTVAAKGSSTPLIDKGELLSSIDYEVGP